jgi:hypothetical protein
VQHPEAKINLFKVITFIKQPAAFHFQGHLAECPVQAIGYRVIISVEGGIGVGYEGQSLAC